MGNSEFGLSSREASPNREAPNRAERGNKRYKKMVDESSKDAAKKNLPFTFSKPSKTASLSVECWCPNCGCETRVSKNTVMVVCLECKKLYSVEKENSIR